MENQIYGNIAFSPIKISIGIIRKKEKLWGERPIHPHGKSILITIKEASNHHKIAFEPIGTGKNHIEQQKIHDWYAPGHRQPVIIFQWK
jgi:hypothetical protein